MEAGRVGGCWEGAETNGRAMEMRQMATRAETLFSDAGLWGSLIRNLGAGALRDGHLLRVHHGPGSCIQPISRITDDSSSSWVALGGAGRRLFDLI